MVADRESNAHTIGQLIAAFGGAYELAGWAGISPEAIFNWKARGEIPAGWHLRLVAEARRRHITIDPQALGLSDEDADALDPVLNCRKRKAAAA